MNQRCEKPCACGAMIYWTGEQQCFDCRQATNPMGSFYFVEDRTRLWRNASGTRYSSALGMELPDSRQGIAAICKAKGIEMTGPQELPHLRRAIEAGRAIRSGEGLTSKDTFAHISEPKERAPTLADTLRSSGKMRNVMERIEVGYENWRDRGESDAVRMAQKGAAVLGEGAALLNPTKPVDIA